MVIYEKKQTTSMILMFVESSQVFRQKMRMTR